MVDYEAMRGRFCVLLFVSVKTPADEAISKDKTVQAPREVLEQDVLLFEDDLLSRGGGGVSERSQCCCCWSVRSDYADTPSLLLIFS